MDIDEYLKESHINCVRKNIARKFNMNLTTSVQKEEDFTQKNVVKNNLIYKIINRFYINEIIFNY